MRLSASPTGLEVWYKKSDQISMGSGYKNWSLFGTSSTYGEGVQVFQFTNSTTLTIPPRASVWFHLYSTANITTRESDGIIRGTELRPLQMDGFQAAHKRFAADGKVILNRRLAARFYYDKLPAPPTVVSLHTANETYVGQAMSINVSYTGNQRQRLVINWGDGSSIANIIKSKTADSYFHTYFLPGNHTVSVLIVDGEGSVTAAQNQIIVLCSGTFSGGGWAYNPAADVPEAGSQTFLSAYPIEGQYIPFGFTERALENERGGQWRATFSFFAELREGRIPLGSVTHRFKDNVFRSRSMESLIFSADCAQLKGRGTINFEGEYKVSLTGCLNKKDESTFRIIIWGMDGLVVFDNMPEVAVDLFVGAPLERGRVNIRR